MRNLPSEKTYFILDVLLDKIKIGIDDFCVILRPSNGSLAL